MTRLQHYAEPKASTGGLAAAGALNLLGRPEIDPLVVLVREAVQNSWDARKSQEGGVGVHIETRILDNAQLEAMTGIMFAEQPPKGLMLEADGTRRDLPGSLRDGVRILSFTDTGTTGLAGPVRADHPAKPKEVTDFVDLVFNIGAPPDKRFGGGTFGFGKSISYLVSRCRTVVIHTRTEHRGGFQTRLIAQAFGHQYSHRRRNFTGRHWWGTLKPHGVEPLTGRAADKLALSLGLPSFEGPETGTTIAIIDPDFGSRTAEQAMNTLSAAALWNFWPKMIPSPTARTSMSFTLSCDGRPVELRRPADFPPLDSFAEALTAVRACEAGATLETFPTCHIYEVRSERPRMHLGWLALHPAPVRAQLRVDEGIDDDEDRSDSVGRAAPFAGRAHHVALMRRAELVVQYLEGPELSTGAIEWTGVFKASESTDRSFAASEPPTHDAWSPALVPDGTMRRHVNIALTRIRSYVNSAFVGHDVDSPQSDPAVLFAEELGHLLAAVGGTGASERRAGNGASKPNRSGPRIVAGRHRHSAEGGRHLLLVDFTVDHVAGSDGSIVSAAAAAASADGVEHDPPTGASVPRVVGFRSGDLIVEGDRLVISGSDPTEWTVLVEQPPSVATALDLSAEAKG